MSTLDKTCLSREYSNQLNRLRLTIINAGRLEPACFYKIASSQAAQEVSRQSSGAAQEVPVEDRACITAAAAKLPNVAALKIERSRALPQQSAQGRRDNVKVEIDVIVAGQNSTYVFNCVRQGQLVVVQPLGMR